MACDVIEYNGRTITNCKELASLCKIIIDKNCFKRRGRCLCFIDIPKTAEYNGLKVSDIDGHCYILEDQE